MQTNSIKVIEPGYYPLGAIALFNHNTWAILSENEEGTFCLWFPGIDDEDELDKVLADLPSGKYDMMGSGWCGSFFECLRILKIDTYPN